MRGTGDGISFFRRARPRSRSTIAFTSSVFASIVATATPSRSHRVGRSAVDEKCVACHSRTWMSTSVMAPIRWSIETGRPIAWARVTQLPDFVYFDHAIHVDRGVGCETCHGRVDRMATAEQVAPLTMGWCLDCHRNLAPRLRPLAEITTMGYRQSPSDTSGARRVGALEQASLLELYDPHRASAMRAGRRGTTWDAHCRARS